MNFHRLHLQHWMIFGFILLLVIGETYYHNAQTVFPGASNAAPLGNSFSDDAVYENGDGQYEHLVMTALLNVTQPGDFLVSAILQGAEQMYLDLANANLFSTTKTLSVPLNFDGQAIRDSGLDGPYTVTQLTLVDTTQYIKLDEIDDAWVTPPYSHLEFGAWPGAIEITKSISAPDIIVDGTLLTYTLAFSGPLGSQVSLYDPLDYVAFERFVASPYSVGYMNGDIIGVVTLTPTNHMTVSFTARVDTWDAKADTVTITNQACIYPVGETKHQCAWSNPVTQVITKHDAITLVVNSSLDAVDAVPGDGICAASSGECTLRAAVQESNAWSGYDTIVLPAGTYTLTLAGTGEDAAGTGDLDITNPVTLTGSGAETTIIDGGGIDRILQVIPPARLNVFSTTLRHGAAEDYGGAILLWSQGFSGYVALHHCVVEENIAGLEGGGIEIWQGTLLTEKTRVISNTANYAGGIGTFGGDLTLNFSSVSHNEAITGVGGIKNNLGNLVLNNSLINGNRAGAGIGGISNDAELTLVNSTVSSNTANMIAGGIRNVGRVTLNNCTVTRNWADVGSGIHSPEDAYISVTLRNTILADNVGDDCYGAAYSAGYNLIGNTTGCTVTLASSDLVSVNARLGPLQDNDGDTLTYALLADSPAIDAGDPDGCIDAGGNSLTVDQRGFPRPTDGDRDGVAVCDIGAYETDAKTMDIRYVAPNGADDDNTCMDYATPCATLQYAVDVAKPGDEIRVATGVYTDLSIRPRNDFTTTGVVTQVVYISKTVTIRGGYTPTAWDWPDPIANPVTLDAQGQGRGLYITGKISPTLEGLHITGGKLMNQNTGAFGAGASVISATVTMSGCQIYSNTTASSGGGLFLYRGNLKLENSAILSNIADSLGGGISTEKSDVVLNNNIIAFNESYSNYYGGGGFYGDGGTITLTANTVISNFADPDGGGILIASGMAKLVNNLVVSNTAGFGGGVSLQGGAASLISNTIVDNRADAAGGGVHFFLNTSTLVDNAIISNTAWANGGGLYLDDSSVVLESNIVSTNTAGFGGGLSMGWLSTLTSTANIYSFNTARYDGGGLDLGSRKARLLNDVIADNHASGQGSGLHVGFMKLEMLHTTIARNTGGDGAGLYVTKYSYGDPSTVFITNTILVSHTIGISVTDYNTVSINGILWDATPITVSLSPSATFFVQNQFVDDPAFDTDGYHLTEASPAVDKGITTPLAPFDIDHQRRPFGLSYDLGADEFVRYDIYLPLVLRNYVTIRADFIAAPTAGPAPLTVIFTNTSSGPYTTSTWDFGDGSPQLITGTLLLPQLRHTYTEPGSYAVTLTISGPKGHDTVTRPSYITVGEPPPVAGFTATPLNGTRPLTVTFTNTSTGSYDHSLWHFGDGITSTLQHPTHTYIMADIYTVSLTVSCLNGTLVLPWDASILTRTNYITVTNAVSHFEGISNNDLKHDLALVGLSNWPQ